MLIDLNAECMNVTTVVSCMKGTLAAGYLISYDHDTDRVQTTEVVFSWMTFNIFTTDVTSVWEHF